MSSLYDIPTDTVSLQELDKSDHDIDARNASDKSLRYDENNLSSSLKRMIFGGPKLLCIWHIITIFIFLALQPNFRGFIPFCGNGSAWTSLYCFL